MAGALATSGTLRGTALRWLYLNLAGLFVVCLPLLIIATNVRRVTLDPATYREGFEKYQAAARTGLDQAQLSRIGQAFIEYFEGPRGQLNPIVTIGGLQRPLFNEREIAHMVDVHSLMQLVFRLGWVSGLYLLLFAAALVATRRRHGLASLGRLLLGGSGLSIGLLLVVGGLSFVDFGELFLRFHELSFSNDLWQLDPTRDYLLILFPEGFWLDVTLKIAALTAAEAAALGLIGLVLTRGAR